MNILAFESSAKAASAAFSRDDGLAAAAWQRSGLTHSATLLPMTEDMLRNCGLSLADADVFAVAAGPGSFTGLRIGVSLVKGLAHALNRPCVGVSTLEALAFLQPQADAVACCVMDARVGQVYNALFDLAGPEPVRLCPDRALPLADLLEELAQTGRRVLLCGDAAALALEKTNHLLHVAAAPEHLRWQHAAGVARLARKMALAGEAYPAAALVPRYLRLPQAQRELEEKKARQAAQNTSGASEESGGKVL